MCFWRHPTKNTETCSTSIKRNITCFLPPSLLWMDSKNFESHLSVVTGVMSTRHSPAKTQRSGALTPGNTTSMRSMTGGLGWSNHLDLIYSLQSQIVWIKHPYFVGSTPEDLYFFQTTSTTSNGTSTSNNKKHRKGHSQNKNSCHSHHLTPLCDFHVALPPQLRDSHVCDEDSTIVSS